MSLRIILLFVMIGFAQAQERSAMFQAFTVEDGLSQGSITAILQDHKGFMWIGTHDGLNRFDGIEFKVFRHSDRDSASLSNNWITRLYEDSDHILWVGTLDGLNRFDRRTQTFRSYHPSTLKDHSEHYVSAIREIGIGRGRQFWVAIGGLFQFNRETEEFIPRVVQTSDSDLVTKPSSFEAQDDTLMWIGGGTGFYRINLNDGTIDERNPLPAVLSLCLPDRQDSLLWIGTARGLFQYDFNRKRLKQNISAFVSSVFEDRSGKIWIVADGLKRIDHNQRNAIHLVPMLSQATSVADDISGSLWVGTFDGLLRMDKARPTFTVYRHTPLHPNSLAHDFVLPIIEDHSGAIWFGTFGGGVSILHGDQGDDPTFTHLTRAGASERRLSSDNVRSILEEDNGRIWVGTAGGLDVLDRAKNKITHFETVPTADTLSLWAETMCLGRDGTVWIGVTTSGLLKVEPRKKRTIPTSAARASAAEFTFTQYPLDGVSGPGESSEMIAIHEDKYHNIWIGTEAGLVRFNPEKERYERFVHDENDLNSLSNDYVWCIFEDTTLTDDILWVGTSAGLNRFDVRAGTFLRYVGQEGFPNACVYAILRDDLGRLWLSTNHGLTCFDDGLPDGKKFKNYDVTDGIQGNEFNRRSACRLRNGEFLFGGTRGVTRFHPLQIQRNMYMPPVVLTTFRKFGKPVVFDRDIADVSSIVLAHDENAFSFEFASLNYTNAAKNQYAYMMEGFDKEWILSGKRRFANYTHLDPGNYVFRVKASNNDDVWNEEGIAVAVTINPPFWGTWWFRVLSFLTITASLFTFYRRRVHSLEKEQHTQQEFAKRLMESQENERKRIAGELHDGLGQNLLVIRNRALLGLRDETLTRKSREQLDQIAAVATQAIDGVREISHDLRPFQLDRLGLTKAIASLVSELGDATQVRFAVDVEAIDDEIEQEQAIHVYRIVQESINNILKHSGATTASVVVHVEEREVRIAVQDNGRGMDDQFLDVNELPGGLGHIGMKERAKVLGGTLTIASEAGKGTTLTVLIPRKGERS